MFRLFFILIAGLVAYSDVSAEDVSVEEEAPSGIIRQLEEARAHAKQISSTKLLVGSKTEEMFSPLKSEEEFSWLESIVRPLYPASELKIGGNYYLSKNRILKLLRPYLAEDLLFIETEAMETVLLKEPWVHAVTVERGYYSGLVEVTLTEERPWLVVQLPDDSWLISKSRLFISPLNSIKDADFQMELSKLPRFVGVVNESGIDRSGLEMGLEVIEKIDAAANFEVSVDFYEFSEEFGLRVIPRDPKQARAREILFANDSFLEIEKRLKQFNLVRADLEDRQEIVSRADLRFSKQIIVE